MNDEYVDHNWCPDCGHMRGVCDCLMSDPSFQQGLNDARLMQAGRNAWNARLRRDAYPRRFSEEEKDFWQMGWDDAEDDFLAGRNTF